MGRHATHGLFINGLRSDFPSGRLRKFILDLLNSLNVPLEKSHINIVPKNNKKIAFVDLVTYENTTQALKYLGSKESRDRLNVNFNLIAYDDIFSIKRIKPKTEYESENKLSQNKSDFSNNGIKTDHGSSYQNLAANSGSTTLNPMSRTTSDSSNSAASKTYQQESSKPSSDIPGTSANQMRNTATSSTEAAVSPRLISLDNGVTVRSVAVRPSNRDVMLIKGKALDAATSVSGLNPVYQGKFYHYNEMLGSETRNVEFKEGKGNYKKKNLSDHVGMYVCGFANTLEGGTLFMGVTDKGQAQGVTCSHAEEDQIRLRIDQAIKTIEPSILPNMYSVAFTPVLLHGTFSENLKVIEVCVHPAESHEELYEFQGKVFVRRDGSVQNFKPKDIKEWAKKKAARENAHSHSVKQQLDEVTNQLHQIQIHIQKPKKTKVCLIL